MDAVSSFLPSTLPEGNPALEPLGFAFLAVLMLSSLPHGPDSGCKRHVCAKYAESDQPASQNLRSHSRRPRFFFSFLQKEVQTVQ